MIVEQEKTLIRKLRLTSDDRDRAALQQKFRTTFAVANFQPDGFPASNIVCIRRLASRMPAFTDGQHATVEWMRGVRAQVAEIAGKGVRPVRGFVPDSAGAVIFKDKAELLACLARDWCDDRIPAHWWWRSLFGRTPTESHIKQFCRANPEYFPAAIEQLALQHKAVAFVQRFSSREAHEQVRNVAQSFGLAALSSVLLRDFQSDLRPVAPQQTHETPEPAIALPAENYSPTPWRIRVPEADTVGLTISRRLLLGVSLMMLRAPADVRGRTFAAEVDSWQRSAVLADSRQFAVQAEDKVIDRSESGSPQIRAAATANADDALPLLSNESARETADLAPDPGSRDFSASETAGLTISARDTADQNTTCAVLVAGTTEKDQASEWLSLDSESSPEIQADNEALPQQHPDVVLGAGAEQAESSPIEWSIVAAPAESDQLATIEAEAETECGGLFYLINLAIRLGLYSDFSNPLESGIQLNIWDFVALLGRELVGQRIQSDPVWALLAILAGRTQNTEPGQDFKPDDEWRMPADWLQPFAREGRCQWTTGGGRLRVLLEEQFTILDVPLDREDGAEDEARGTALQLECEMKAYERFEFRISRLALSDTTAVEQVREPGNSELDSSARLAAWLDCLMPYVRERLRKALGAEATQDPGAIFRSHAKVVVSGTHLDVFLALAELPLEIRIAGLDRDPGWVPAAGRFIAFHFD